MIAIPAQCYDYKVLDVANADKNIDIYPFFRTGSSNIYMWLISPQHGRSYIVKRYKERYIISKGNGLSYTNCDIIKINEQDFELWGLLRLKDAMRDYNLGREIASLGIKTNQMEAVIELDFNLRFLNEELIKNPILLQYSVECPYRISDGAFISQKVINRYIKDWRNLDKWHCDANYKIAAHVLTSNLRILHDHEILHNALTPQNITWALELLDFEIASSPNYPFEREDYRRHIPDLFSREILHIYQIILDIAWILREKPDYNYLDSLFKDYDFDFQTEFKLINTLH